MTRKNTKALKRKKVIRNRIILAVLVCIVVILAVVVGVTYSTVRQQREAEAAEYAKGVPPSPATDGEASVAVTGDILMHMPVLNSVYQSDGTYDISSCLSAISPYWSSADYMIANLEVTLGGEGTYSGYPTFSSPDSLVTDLKEAGVDCLLTANNHAYDSGENGMIRTLQVVEENGLDYMGTRQSTEESYVLTKDINGIIFGMVCYTYDTRSSADSQKSLNGITMSDTAEDLVNSFCYSDLNSLYASVSEDLSEMETAGCDVTMVFIHWGDEYRETPNDYQTTIAQELANLGVDIIVGGHPHVIQEFTTLTGTNGNETLVLYSTGNALSNQRRDLMTSENRGYTEDGLMIEFTYIKFNNGTVKLEEVYILPTWVELSGGQYKIVPLDYSIGSASWSTSQVSEAIASYNRTMGRLGTIYPSIRLELGLEAVPESM